MIGDSEILSRTHCDGYIEGNKYFFFLQVGAANALLKLNYKISSSLFYNTSARHKRHVCDTSDMCATRVRHEQHDWDKSATQTTRVRHKCYKNDTSATQMKNFDFDNDTSENIFSHPCINYMVNEWLQREEQFHSKNYLLEMPCSHAKMRLKIAPQKLNFVMAKAVSKIYTLNCSCKWPFTFPHSYT